MTGKEICLQTHLADSRKLQFCHVFITFLLLEQNVHIHRLKERRFVLAQFVAVSVPSWVAARPGGVEEGHDRGETANGRVGRGGMTSSFSFILSTLQAYWLVPPTLRVVLPSLVNSTSISRVVLNQSVD